MVGYFLNRLIISRRFEEVESGYVYRRRSDLPGIALTSDERDETLREFRRRYWKSWFKMVGVAFLVAMAFAMLAVALGIDESQMEIFGFSFAAILLVVILREQRKWSLLPEKLFADHPRVSPDIQPGGWFNRYKYLARRRSWLSHTGLIAVYGAMSWLLAPRTFDANIFHWFLFLCFSLGLLSLIYGAFLKARDPTQ